MYIHGFNYIREFRLRQPLLLCLASNLNGDNA